MQIEMNETELHTLRQVLEDYLPQLRLEVARTEAHEFRHELLKRLEVCEHLLDLLRHEHV